MKRILIAAVLAVGAIMGASSQSVYRSPAQVKAARGATLYGVVECGGHPVPGVVVSDGYETAVTDRKGRYNLKSDKAAGQVFISVPSGYEAQRSDVVPDFWADLTEDPAIPERHDFCLERVPGGRHAMIAIADPHIANERDDVYHMTGPYLDRIRAEVDGYRSRGIPVYTICLGDGSWDRLWYELDFPVDSFRTMLAGAGYPTPLFNVMGNHDNDGAMPEGPDVDRLAARPYMKAFGPRYYSFNIGDVHYVVLDNVVYKNESNERNLGNLDIYGSCNYDRYITPEQIQWLRKDLARVADPDAPLVVAMHCPTFRFRSGDKEVYIDSNKENIDSLREILAPFTNVHFLSGHTHFNALCPSTPDFANTVWEHTVAGTCGSWWWNSAYGGRNLCPDGNPVGYQVYDFDGKDMSWRFEPFEYEKGQRFYAFDMNAVRNWFATNAEARAFKRHYPAWTDYSDLPDNVVYVAVWDWDPEGRLEASALGEPLGVSMVYDVHPMYMATYMIRKTVWEDKYGKGYDKPRKRRLFRIQAPSPDCPVEITYTDRFGNSSTRTLVRPGVFDRSVF